jgi:hypothetical protein
MTKPRCNWLSSSGRVNRPVTFQFTTGGLECTLDGVRVPKYSYPPAPAVVQISAEFPLQGTYTWTVTNADGVCTSTVTILS